MVCIADASLRSLHALNRLFGAASGIQLRAWLGTCMMVTLSRVVERPSRGKVSAHSRRLLGSDC